MSYSGLNLSAETSAEITNALQRVAEACTSLTARAGELLPRLTSAAQDPASLAYHRPLTAESLGNAVAHVGLEHQCGAAIARKLDKSMAASFATDTDNAAAARGVQKAF